MEKKPIKKESTALSIRVPNDILAKMRELASQERRSLNQYVNLMLEAHALEQKAEARK